MFLSCERDTTPVRYQWALALTTVDHNLKPLLWPGRCDDCDVETPVDLVDVDAQLCGQRLGQRRFHDPLESGMPADVVGQLVVSHDAPEDRLVLRHDAERAVVAHDPFSDGFAVLHIRGTLATDDVHRHSQPNGAVKAPEAAMVEPGPASTWTGHCRSSPKVLPLPNRAVSRGESPLV